MTGYTFTPLWDILLPLTWTPDRRDRRLLVSPPKDTDVKQSLMLRANNMPCSRNFFLRSFRVNMSEGGATRLLK